MRVAIVHDRVDIADAPDQVDVLAQADAVDAALTDLGHHVVRMECGLDFETLRQRLCGEKTDLVFNLVESIEGKGKLIHLFPFFLDGVHIPYTGAPAEAMLSTSCKLTAKEKMRSAAISTPPWVQAHGNIDCSKRLSPAKTDWIIKSVWEHASIGLDGTSIFRGISPAKVRARLRLSPADGSGELFAEQFIDGREFNIALLATPNAPQVLPPAEILFEGFTDEMPKIVDYRAKWDASAYSYHHTPRRFDFTAEDLPLLEDLTRTARACWHLFGLRGYARVDFRVDGNGRPWVLEVNTNPCLSPDAGFQAALDRAGIGFREAVRRIMEDC